MGRHVPAEFTAAASAQTRALGIVTLIAWVCTAGAGAYMLGTLVASGALRRPRTAGDGLPPAVLLAHFGLAGTGLATWVSYVVSGWAVLAWTAVGLLMLAIGLGVCIVTLWTPYPRPRAAASAGPPADPGAVRATGGPRGAPAREPLAGPVSDEVFARALTDDVLASQLVDQAIASVPKGPGRAARNRTGHLAAALIPAGHGVGAVATFALAMVTAASIR